MAASRTVRRGRQIIAIAAIAVISAGVGASSIVSMGARNIASPVYTQREPIMDQLVTVEARGFKYFEFSIAERIINAAVTGEFSSAGSDSHDSDLIVTIVPENTLQSISEGKGYDAYYFSGKVSNGEINAKMPGRGTFFIILDNRFSDSSKTVDARIELVY